MSAVPQGAFATFKIKQNWKKPNEPEWREEEKTAPPNLNEHALEHPPFKYSSKLINSVWGSYNRYSVHNLKKNSDSLGFDLFNGERRRL